MSGGLMLEYALVGLCFVAPVIVIPWLICALASLVEGFPRLRIGQICWMIAVVAVVIACFTTELVEWILVSLVVIIPVMFAGMWMREFRLLMLRRADEFPDRFDKLAWILTMTVFAPAGVWLMRSFRRTHWPDAKAATRPHPLDQLDPGADVPEMPRIGA
jgi:Ca2+/Na+ antiporter